MAAYDDLVSVAELKQQVRRWTGRTGVRILRDAVPLVDENVWSPPESDLRWDWHELAGLPPVMTNRPVFDRRGRHLGTPDLLEPTVGLAVEYDGVIHLDAVRRRNDVDREERFRAAGLEYATIVAGADRHARALRLQRIWERARASRDGGREQSWTVDPPVWWTPTDSVEARRALSLDDRVRLLGYRSAS